MKIYVQVVDTNTGIYNTGMIEESVCKGAEIDNALRCFGVMYGEVEWVTKTSMFASGIVAGTSKVVSIIIV